MLLLKFGEQILTECLNMLLLKFGEQILTECLNMLLLKFGSLLKPVEKGISNGKIMLYNLHIFLIN